MAVMPSQERFDCWADFMRSESGAFGALSKQDLRAAVDAADQWCSDNAASFNSALPQPTRGVLTTVQKARLLAWIVLKRHKVGI